MKQLEGFLTLSRNFQVPIPAVDGTLERAVWATVEVKLSGKNTGDIGCTFCVHLYPFLFGKMSLSAKGAENLQDRIIIWMAFKGV